MESWERTARRIFWIVTGYAVCALGLARHLGRVGDEQLWTDS